ncbi:peptidoglycan/LPS O-acetylase OafA/YrhL [Novosphingobium kunmingense]|uniref:Peptidoglycan/LPS O-acetylase OafA/YrhL n=1 Tax=Novosphingobium kunmingense TaxID=1211806 RepID=A0A2N0I167_9SPHN|nr:acyltransferase [Novosphingobium kunmingense]PKB24933.1 peptidoglycan/LPS O-acetylase OafA/YrhL [Novosphingobium kunmingense]
MQPAKLAFVDRLRGIAILLVIAMHYLQVFASPILRDWNEIGQVGVQLFFVASAFTLCLSADNRRDEPHRLRAYAIRRWFRIAPVYYVGIAFYAWMFIVSGEGAPYTVENVLANLFLVHGLLPFANNNVVPGGWTIGTEMLFYAAFPLLYPALEAGWKRWGNRALIVAFALAVLVAVAWQLGFRLHYGRWLANNSYAYGSFVNQLPVFVAGMGWYLAAWRGGGMAPRPVRDTVLAAVLFGSCWLILGLELLPFNGILPTLAALGWVLFGNVLRGKGGEGGWLGAVGRVSYSLYLIHFALVWRPSAWLLQAVEDVPNAQALLLVPLYVAEVALLYPIARLVWRFVEQPGNQLGQKLIDWSNNPRKPAAPTPT